MIVGERPVNEIKIHIIALQILDTLSAGFLHISVHIVPYFCHNEEILSLHHAFIESRLEHFANLMLIAIARRTVEHAVAASDGSCHSRGNILRGNSVRAKGPHTDAGNFLPGGKGYFRHDGRVDEFCHNDSPSLMLFIYWGSGGMGDGGLRRGISAAQTACISATTLLNHWGTL